MTTLLVSEVFGPTVQGEGPSAGRRAGFLRLGLCNLDCAWCDTPYTWDWTGKNGPAYDKDQVLERVTLEAVVERLRHMHVGLVVVTGGEPLLQQKRLAGVVAALRLQGMRVEIETNGTIAPTPNLVAWEPRFNVSPKLAHSGVDRDRAWNLDALAAFPPERTILKFVVTGEEDLAEVTELVDLVGFERWRVWIMPEGRSHERTRDVLRGVADSAIAQGYNLSPRLHVELWGDERGR